MSSSTSEVGSASASCGLAATGNTVSILHQQANPSNYFKTVPGKLAAGMASLKQSGRRVLDRLQAASRDTTSRKLFACYVALAAAGWNDASLGPLIPYIEGFFHIDYTTVSTMFVASCVGYIIAGVTNNKLTNKLGMGKVVTTGAVFQTLGYAIYIAPPPFAVLSPSYILVGLGVAYQVAGANAWVASLPTASTQLAYLQAAYGVGALSAPLVATQFVKAGIRWSFFFSVSLSIAAATGIILFSLLWRDPLDGGTGRNLESDSTSTTAADLSPRSPDDTRAIIALEALRPAASASVHPRQERAREAEIYSNRFVWLAAFFLLCYVGAEVSIGGWVASFLIDERSGGEEAGYVASGFWAGITLGRLVLPRFGVWFGERRVIFLYITLAIALELVVWLVKDLVSNAIAVSLVGFLIATFYPIAVSIIAKLLPRHLCTGAIGLMAAIGSAGSAILPFLTGVLAQRYGTWVLQPVVISLLICMASLWAFVPSPARRTE